MCGVGGYLLRVRELVVEGYDRPCGAAFFVIELVHDVQGCTSFRTAAQSQLAAHDHVQGPVRQLGLLGVVRVEGGQQGNDLGVLLELVVGESAEELGLQAGRLASGETRGDFRCPGGVHAHPVEVIVESLNGFGVNAVAHETDADLDVALFPVLAVLRNHGEGFLRPFPVALVVGLFTPAPEDHVFAIAACFADPDFRFAQHALEDFLVLVGSLGHLANHGVVRLGVLAIQDGIATSEAVPPFAEGKGRFQGTLGGAVGQAQEVQDLGAEFKTHVLGRPIEIGHDLLQNGQGLIVVAGAVLAFGRGHAQFRGNGDARAAGNLANELLSLGAQGVALVLVRRAGGEIHGQADCVLALTAVAHGCLGLFFGLEPLGAAVGKAAADPATNAEESAGALQHGFIGLGRAGHALPGLGVQEVQGVAHCFGGLVGVDVGLQEARDRNLHQGETHFDVSGSQLVVFLDCFPLGRVGGQGGLDHRPVEGCGVCPKSLVGEYVAHAGVGAQGVERALARAEHEIFVGAQGAVKEVGGARVAATDVGQHAPSVEHQLVHLAGAAFPAPLAAQAFEGGDQFRCARHGAGEHFGLALTQGLGFFAHSICEGELESPRVIRAGFHEGLFCGARVGGVPVLVKE